MDPTTTPEWRTSTRSGDNGGACVEVAVLPVTGSTTAPADRV
ncbi:DUF397 domain-containing protein [Actinoallomurus soli]|nr:DUF397 domain-containing protein [Actinoallomurus soli]MCO5972936.1 DUF397 domain-containing protein [Actinoallomurus soli]